jgi:decaprenyl-phosphate phosphoribosyltransferase
MNDLFDRDADRAHPTKRFRPVAAGVISPAAAAISALVLMASAVAIGGSVLGARFGVALGFYAGINVAYNVGLKREPVIDMAAVASGFVIRAIAGGLAAGVVLSNWFLIVASFGSLFVVAGKRHADYGALAGVGRSDTLAADYTDVFLRFVRTVAAGVAICGYCLWAFDRAAGVHRGRAVWLELTVVPFVLAVLRYALLVEAGEGGAPEDVILGNRVILALGAIWLALFVVGVYGSGGIGLG